MSREVRSVPNSACVVKVGGGRGFIVEQRIRVKVPRVEMPKDLGPGLPKREFLKKCRVVVTAAHCLRELPPANAASSFKERTYPKLLGKLDQAKTEVSAECLFADPIADIAVLGCPDEEELSDEADAFHELVDNLPVLRIGNARSGRGWVLSLDGQWVRTTVKVFSDIGCSGLSTDPTKAGMSGSPVLNAAGRAVGVVVLGRGPQPMLTRNLPGWLL